MRLRKESSKISKSKKSSLVSFFPEFSVLWLVDDDRMIRPVNVTLPTLAIIKSDGNDELDGIGNPQIIIGVYKFNVTSRNPELIINFIRNNMRYKNWYHFDKKNIKAYNSRPIQQDCKKCKHYSYANIYAKQKRTTNSCLKVQNFNPIKGGRLFSED